MQYILICPAKAYLKMYMKNIYIFEIIKYFSILNGKF